MDSSVGVARPAQISEIALQFQVYVLGYYHAMVS